MDNRRPTTNDAPRPSNQTNNYRKDQDNYRQDNYRQEGQKPFGTNRFQSAENRFPPRNDRFQSREARPPANNTGSNAGSSDRPPHRNDRFQSREDRPPNRDGRFQGRDNRSQTSESRFQPRNDKFQPRGRFAPKGKIVKPWEQEDRPRIVSDMQVTDGKHRGKYLQSTTSAKVRPTARRIREVMFRILFRRVRAGRFLDLCAGAGTVGIEAISRGALIGTFVERSGQMCGFIKKNLEACGIKEGHGEIHQIEVVPFLKKMDKRRRFWDVVYFDPPYDSNYEEVLAYFSRGVALRSGGVLVIEHPAEMFFQEKFGVMTRWRVVVQGETALSFYEKK